jgi:hypothetical protein
MTAGGGARVPAAMIDVQAATAALESGPSHSRWAGDWANAAPDAATHIIAMATIANRRIDIPLVVAAWSPKDRLGFIPETMPLSADAIWQTTTKKGVP